VVSVVPNLPAPTTVRPETYYYHPDHLGSTSWVTDQNGKVHEHAEYYPFGEVWFDPRYDADGAPVKGQQFLFSSKEFDEETGLFYFGLRYYDPKQARWKSADTALATYLPSGAPKHDARLPGIGGAFNALNLSLYAYAHQSPAVLVDPDGRWSSMSHYPFEPVHQMAIQNVLGNQTNQVGAQAIRIMQERQVAMDTQQAPNVQYRHSMMDSRARDAKGQRLSREAQIQQAEAFLRSRLESARAAETPEVAFSDLGDAIHTAQDATSPPHRGFQDWYMQGTGGAHVWAERSYPAQGTRERRELEGATQWMYDIFRGAEMPDRFYDRRTGELLLPERYRNLNQ
jgi:RHS repeat-associated protein